VKHWFADTFGEFWGGLLYSILETLVIVVVGALAIWALAAGIGALIVALGFAAVATAKIALIIGVVLLVLVIIPMMIYNRVQEYHQDNPGKEIGVWTGIGLGLLGIADVTGIPFIIEAAVGQRATGGELHGWDRGFRLGQGIVMLGTLIFGAYRFFKGRGSGPIVRNEPPAVDPNAPPVPDPNAPPVPDPNAPPVPDPNAPPAPEPRDLQPEPPSPARQYDPSTRTGAQLVLDQDPTPGSGETPDLAARRARLATEEIESRRQLSIIDGLGDEPREVDVRADDATHRSRGAHSVDKHGADIPLEMPRDAAGNRLPVPTGTKTIEGRIFGDTGWARPENNSFKWKSDAIMNNTVNEYMRTNWDQIRLDLAEGGQHSANFNARNGAVGEGFFDPNQTLPGPPGGRPPAAAFMETSLVRITIELIPGPPPDFFIVTTFPNALGAPVR
jgi:hypothetical protein